MNLEQKEKKFEEFYKKFGEVVPVYTGKPKTTLQIGMMLVAEEGEFVEKVAEIFDLDEQELHLASDCQRLHNRWLDSLG